MMLNMCFSVVCIMLFLNIENGYVNIEGYFEFLGMEFNMVSDRVFLM